MVQQGWGGEADRHQEHSCFNPDVGCNIEADNEGGASFNDSFDQALQHLIRNEMIARDSRYLLIALPIKDDVRSVKLPQFGEYKPRTKNRGLRDRTPSFPVDLERLKIEMPGFSLDYLVEYGKAAKDVADMRPGKSDLAVQINAFIAYANVREELISRGVFTKDGELNPAFRWPSTKSTGGDGSMVLPEDLPEISPLRLMGYTVGNNGLPKKERERLLTEAFLGLLPSTPDVDKWGDPDTDVRLMKIAYHLAGLVKIDKKKLSRDMSEAIRMREDDLAFLKAEYYDGRFDGTGGFKYPMT